MLGELADSATRAEVQEPSGTVAAAGQYGLAVGAEGDDRQAAGLLRQRPDLSARI